MQKQQAKTITLAPFGNSSIGLWNISSPWKSEYTTVYL